MLLKILKNDLLRNRTISVILLLFIMFSAVLVSGAAAIISSLQGSVDNLFKKADALHFLQMHAGEIDKKKIDAFAKNNPLVTKHQIITMLNIEGDNVFLGNDELSLSGSYIDIGFVTQSPGFDYLLDLENEIITVEDGEVAVPIYYMKEYSLSVGDKLLVRDGAYSKTFTIACFLRDSQMNSTLASSKRFLISEADHAELSSNTGNMEYLIEFQLSDANRASEFASAYQAAGLPSQGPAIEYSLLRMINMLTDGMIAAIIILAGILLMLIAMLCLRFTILAALEEDMLEIGVMKAIGISHRDIRQLYITKYLVFAGVGSSLGYLTSLYFSNMFTKNIVLYMGAPEKTVWTIILPLLAAGFVFLLVALYCRKLLNSMRYISALEAMYPLRIASTKKRRLYLSLKNFNHIGSNTYLVLQDLLVRPRTFALLLLLFVVCVFLVLVPINLLNTLQSPLFIEYMGVSQSDVRMDLQQHEDLQGLLSDISNDLAEDARVEKWASFATFKCKLQLPDGAVFSLDVETGDFSIFPIAYLEGTMPTQKGEIALSYLWAQELNSNVGDVVELLLPNGTKTSMRLSGIYQDFTNGGKSAKAVLPDMGVQPIRSLVILNVVDSKYITSLIGEYKAAFSSAKITNIKSYMDQIFGSMIFQTRLVALVATAISAGMVLLIVSLFLKLLLAKDTAQNAVMMSIGFSKKDVRRQYFGRILGLMFIGVLLGVITANTLGQVVVSVMFSQMGVPKLRFVIEPLQVYVLIPILLLLVSALAIWLGTKSSKNGSISTLNAE